MPVRTPEDPVMLQAEVQAFRERYPFDEEAFNYLANSPAEVQRQVLREFKPKVEGQPDYSALVITFAKRCRGAHAASALPWRPAPAPGPTLAPAPALAPPLAVHHPTTDLSAGPSLAEYEAFRQRYPHDEAAHKYLMNSSPDVQVQALRTFRPPREGEADYSALFITYTKRCRLNAQAAPPPQVFRGGCGDGTARYGAQGGFPPPRHVNVPQADLDGFRQRYPMDDRAYVYLQESLPEVQRQVVETFVPKRADDVDFSAPIVAYAKLCRARFNEAASFGLNPIAASPGVSAYPAQCCPQQPPAPAMDHQALASELSAFCQRFPMDQRACDFLYESPPVVITRVLHEFRPKREGDADYSAAIVYFVGVCRKEAGFDVNSGGAAGVKRVRVGV